VPLDELDFRKRAHVPLSGWPFDRSTLQPFYERAQDLVEAGALIIAPRRRCQEVSWSRVPAMPKC
jgi:hypothetical protein